MGWLDKLRRKPPEKSKYAQMLNGYTPIFSQFGDNIYASDVVQQAIRCIVDEIKKSRMVHIRYKGNDPVPVTDSLQRVLNNPNPLMTSSEFLEKIAWTLLLNYNAFVLPTYSVWYDNAGVEKRNYDGLYPLNPRQVDFIEDASGRMFVKMYFANNFNTTIPYENLIHIRINYSVNEFMGGNAFGQPDHRPLLDTLEVNKSLLDGIAKSMNASCMINGIVKYNTLLDDGSMADAVREFERKIQDSQSGILPLDLKGEYTQIKREVKLVDEPTLKFIDEKILRNWGVPLAILTGDYTKEQYEAFYQKTIEPLIISISQAMTMKVFTDREKSYGNCVKLYPKDLIFMTVSQTIEMVQILANTGSIYENEKRIAFGMVPLPELEGKRYMSLNWIDVDIANQHQIGELKNEEE